MSVLEAKRRCPMLNAPPNRRRRFQFGLGTVLGLIAFAAIVAWWATWTQPPFPFPGHTRPVKEISIEFYIADSPNFRWRISDPKRIDSIVNSLRRSKPIPPRSLIAFADVVLQYDDGSTDELHAFRPFGFWTHQGDQFLGDFPALRNECRKAVQNSGIKDAAMILNEPMFWE